MERYRIRADAAVYFVTYSVVEWLPIFISATTCQIVVDSLCYCHREKHLRISAYVIMPTHLHLIVFDADFDPERLSRTLTDFRKFTGRQLSDACANHFPQCFVDTLRQKAAGDRERRFWQASRHPEAIQSENFWQQKADYVHDNPSRKGLVRRADHWRYSSAGWYLSDGATAVDVPISPIMW